MLLDNRVVATYETRMKLVLNVTFSVKYFAEYGCEAVVFATEFRNKYNRFYLKKMH